MSIAIVCKFLPATNTKPRRISARIGDRKPIIRSYPIEGTMAESYAAVAKEALALDGFASSVADKVLHGGATEDGDVFVVSTPWSQTFLADKAKP